jgi:hypothetical protein
MGVNIKVNGAQGLAYLGMCLVAFIIMVAFGKNEKGNKWTSAMLLSIFAPMMTPLLLVLFIKTLIKDRKIVLGLYSLGLVIIITLQIYIFYILK